MHIIRDIPILVQAEECAVPAKWNSQAIYFRIKDLGTMLWIMPIDFGEIILE